MAVRHRGMKGEWGVEYLGTQRPRGQETKRLCVLCVCRGYIGIRGWKKGSPDPELEYVGEGAE